MIGYLTGEVKLNTGSYLVVLTSSGVGYQVNMNTAAELDSFISVYVSHIKREDAEILYGFESINHKILFEHLLSVNGVGPKSAYSLMVSLGAESVIQAIVLEQVDILKKAPGVGAKAAAKIVLDLKDKLSKLELVNKEILSSRNVSLNLNQAVIAEVVQAGMELGYKEKDILAIIKNNQLAQSEMKSNELLKLVLRELNF
jgi:Holliday junction DNA helicase RuvA